MPSSYVSVEGLQCRSELLLRAAKAKSAQRGIIREMKRRKIGCRIKAWYSNPGREVPR